MTIACNTMRLRGDLIAQLHMPPTWYCVQQAWLETELPPAQWLEDETEELLVERNAYQAMIDKLI
jgi:hypothetical protein